MACGTTCGYSLDEVSLLWRQAPESLTSLDVGHRTLEDWGLEDEEGHVLPNTHVLRGFFGLRSLSCHVRAPKLLCFSSTTCNLQPAVR